jgi:hypothetical protein
MSWLVQYASVHRLPRPPQTSVGTSVLARANLSDELCHTVLEEYSTTQLASITCQSPCIKYNMSISVHVAGDSLILGLKYLHLSLISLKKENILLIYMHISLDLIKIFLDLKLNLPTNSTYMLTSLITK